MLKINKKRMKIKWVESKKNQQNSTSKNLEKNQKTKNNKINT